MSWLSKLLGGGTGATNGASAAGPSEAYEGFTIHVALKSAGSEYQLAGAIEKEIAGELKRYEFVRADRFSSKSDAETATLAKGRQIIDEQGAGIFSQSWPARPN